MTDESPLHTERRLAESFGSVADAYDEYRPEYPQVFIRELIDSPHLDVLDIGAGTGIASLQMMKAGANVLAIEPDARMARVAATKRVRIEHAAIEEWDPNDRIFDLVVCAQSFHWLQPDEGLTKIASLLKPEGRLALLWNQIRPTSPVWEDLVEIYSDYLDVTWKSTVDAVDITRMLERHGFMVQEKRILEYSLYDTHRWINMVFTYSDHLQLEPRHQAELRSRLAQRLGDTVETQNDGLAIIGRL